MKGDLGDREGMDWEEKKEERLWSGCKINKLKKNKTTLSFTGPFYLGGLINAKHWPYYSGTSSDKFLLMVLALRTGSGCKI